MLSDKLYFHSKSRDQKPGFQLYDSVKNIQELKLLGNCRDWRRKLTNSYECNIEIEGKNFNSVDHYMSTFNNFKDIKQYINSKLYTILYHKFKYNLELNLILLLTKNSQLYTPQFDDDKVANKKYYRFEILEVVRAKLFAESMNYQIICQKIGIAHIKYFNLTLFEEDMFQPLIKVNHLNIFCNSNNFLKNKAIIYILYGKKYIVIIDKNKLQNNLLKNY